eukprot:5975207-Amphidinium_carterae.1
MAVDADEDMTGEQEPSQKKPRGMGGGTPSVPATPTEIASPGSPSPRSPPQAEESAGTSSGTSPPEQATAEAAAATEAAIDE